MSDSIRYKKFDVNSRVSGNETGYFVLSNKKFEMGDVIEECPTRRIDSIMETFYSGDIPPDESLMDGVVATIDPNRPGTSLSLVGGNFIHYKLSDNPNAICIHDPRFSVVTVRATKQINIGDEIFIEQIVKTPKDDSFEDLTTSKTQDGVKLKKKEKGCGCGKRKNPTKANKSYEGKLGEVNKSPKAVFGGAPTIMRKDSPKINKKFKSMEKDEELKSIEVKK